ncbi:MAG: 50S ribosomal protein L23 [bacterium]|nr:50S ribosomal protein L23 [bacterium]
MKDPREVIIRPIVTERSFDQIEGENRYTFEVAKTSNKIEIAKAIHDIFGVDVVKVNIVNVKAKPKRVRAVPGYTRTWKKAIVKLAEGQTIDFYGTM